MVVRRILTVLAIPCALISAERAIGQDRASVGPQDTAQPRIVPSPNDDLMDQRTPVVPEPEREAPITMLEAWDLGDGAELGIGRFRVMQPARPPSHVERVRAPLDMERETRGIAGAGLIVRFGGWR